LFQRCNYPITLICFSVAV